MNLYCLRAQNKAIHCSQFWLLQCDMKHQVKIDQQRPVCRPHLAQVPFSCLVGQCFAYSIKKEEFDGSGIPVRRVSGYFSSIMWCVCCRVQWLHEIYHSFNNVQLLQTIFLYLSSNSWKISYYELIINLLWDNGTNVNWRYSCLAVSQLAW